MHQISYITRSSESFAQRWPPARSIMPAPSLSCQAGCCILLLSHRSRWARPSAATFSRAGPAHQALPDHSHAAVQAPGTQAHERLRALGGGAATHAPLSRHCQSTTRTVSCLAALGLGSEQQRALGGAAVAQPQPAGLAVPGLHLPIAAAVAAAGGPRFPCRRGAGSRRSTAATAAGWARLACAAGRGGASRRHAR